MTWTGGFGSAEPPQGVDHVRDGAGHVMDRQPEQCDFCGPGHSLWRWRHNGGTECWLDMDGYAPWTEVEGKRRPTE